MSRTFIEIARGWLRAWDLHLLRNYTYVWSRGGIGMTLGFMIWLISVIVASLLSPVRTSFIQPNVMFLFFVHLCGLVACGMIIAAAVAKAEKWGLTVGAVYTWPDEEKLELSAPEKLWAAAPAALCTLIAIVGIRLPYDIMMWRIAGLAEMPALIDDLNAINEGLAVSAIRYPQSEAALNRRPLPMSSSAIEYLRDREAAFVDPRVWFDGAKTALQQSDSEAQDRQVVALETALRKYAEFEARPDQPFGGYFRQHLNDLDVAPQEDPRSLAEKVCANISLKTLRTADLNIIKIIEAKRYQAGLAGRLLHFGAYALLGLIAALTFTELRLADGMAWAASGYVALYAVSVALEYSNAQFPAVLFLITLAISIRAWWWIRNADSPWSRDDQQPALTVVFPGALILCHLLEGPIIFGKAADWPLALVAMIPFWMFWNKLADETQQRIAQPSQGGHNT